jgi:hypothetical protein
MKFTFKKVGLAVSVAVMLLSTNAFSAQCEHKDYNVKYGHQVIIKK